MISDRAFASDFENEVRSAYRQIKNRDIAQANLFDSDLQRIEELLVSFKPFPSGYKFENDFLIGAVDGSGMAPVVQYEDVFLYLITVGLTVHNTGTNDGRIMELKELRNQGYIPDGGRLTVAFWSSFDEDVLWQNFVDYVKRVYLINDLNNLLVPYFIDYTKGKLDSVDKILRKYGKSDISDFVISPPVHLPERILDMLRWSAEISMAKRALDSNLNLKYVILDTTLTLLFPARYDYPHLLHDYMLRDLCFRARKEGVIVMALSKSHTIPGGEKIIQLARRKYGPDAHWFCRIPGNDDPGGKLKICRKRRIPPELGVTYLFSFTSSMPAFRVDFDRRWWESKIYDNNAEKMRMNEINIFREIDFMSHDARWYGYPCPPAFAHLSCSLTREDRDLFYERVIEIGKEEGFSEESLLNPRRRIGLE
ncbi:hypothetical protein [Candidatus Hecatella orcuttiae]|jgi:hypothetical protein|uniref:hypothetical protein n=1 Tax=Candidatus Hecatella orcuttiae TaxID=1935119 RepID=UPI002867E353|nr:hypothetical protein [Candidatus Hecatella orcuttiae]